MRVAEVVTKVHEIIEGECERRAGKESKKDKQAPSSTRHEVAARKDRKGNGVHVCEEV